GDRGRARRPGCPAPAAGEVRGSAASRPGRARRAGRRGAALALPRAARRHRGWPAAGGVGRGRAGMTGSWKQRREGGGLFAMWLLRTVSLRVGRGVARVLLYPITAYFLLRRGEERRDSRAYLSRVFGRPARMHEVARHMHTFAA